MTTHREGVKTDKIKGKCRVLERKIAHTNHLIMVLLFEYFTYPLTA